MNVIFHTTTAIGVTVLLTDTKRLEQTNSSKTFFLTAVFAFVVGLISHGPAQSCKPSVSFLIDK